MYGDKEGMDFASALNRDFAFGHSAPFVVYVYDPRTPAKRRMPYR